MVGKLTLATEAQLIIREECLAHAAAELTTLSDDELRKRVHALLARHIGDDDTDLPGYLPNPAAMPRDEMIVLLADHAVDSPPTFAIPEDADDPLVGAARKLRREGWERNVVEIIRAMRLSGPAADRHREMAQQAEIEYLRQLIEETWALPMADLRLRAVEIVAKLAGGSDGERAFAHDPDELSRRELLSAIADHIEWLTLPADWRRGPLVRDAD